MEGNDWYNRTGYTDYRNHLGGDDRPIDQDRFRGSYRFDNESPDRNETTYNGFDRSEHRQQPQNRRAGELSNRRDFERDWSGTYHNDRSPGHDFEHDSKYTFRDERGHSRNWNTQFQPTSGSYGSRSGGNADQEYNRSQNEDWRRSGHSNFNATYNPDHYGSGHGENYGNMAGSLSYGYDGSTTYNQDWNRRYDPLSGELRNSRPSYHGHYTSRHPDFYSEGERRRNSEDFRDLDRY
ncbi:hypothetical protein [Pontibacter liquoris]|uniref:hypothetical protein n=1 Tax=Pontibacter liquoris TaxID=2905677 RepID=UPI001FA72DAE|nr:hypothetical protein [Pontibacter liquoris]